MEAYIASDLFINIYQYFNVFDQRDRMHLLSSEEIYLLLELCINSYSIDDVTVIMNLEPYLSEIKKILSLHKNEVTIDEDLKALQKKYGHYLNVTFKDKNLKDLPSIFTKEEVRELKLKTIL